MAENNEAENGLFNRNFILFLILNTVAFLSFQILVPLVPVYALEFSATESQIGILAGVIALAAMIIRPFTGRMADIGDRKQLILFSQLATAAAIACLIVAPNIFLLIAARFAHGVFFGISSTVLTTSAILTMPEKQMAKGIGFLGMTGIGSLAVAPAIGIGIAEQWGFPALFIFTCILSGVSGLLVFIIPPGIMKPLAKKDDKAGVSLRDMLAFETFGVVGLAVCLAVATAIVTNFLVVFTDVRMIPNVGLYFTIYACIVIAARLFNSKVSDRFPFAWIVTVCGALVAIGMVIISAAYSFAPLAMAAVLIGVGYGIGSPTIQTVATQSVPPERRGSVSATFFFGIDFAFVLGPFVGGNIAEAAGYGAGYLWFAIPPLLVVPFSFILERKKVSIKERKKA